MHRDDMRVMQLVTDMAAPDTARLTIYGDIAAGDWLSVLVGEDGAGTTTGGLDVAQALASLPEGCKAVEVHINSYGGEVAEGVAIYNALRSCGREVTTVCDGFACSIASVIFMAGEKRIMRPASLLMLHDPWNRVQGNSKQLRKAADDLDTIAQLSKTAYLTGTKLDAETLDSIMEKETWVAPQQALEWGLATEIADPAEGERPEQSVRAAIVERLTENAAVPVASVNVSGEQLESIVEHAVRRAMDGIQQPMQAAPAPAEPEPEPEPEPPVQESAYQRLARLLGATTD